jgi:hypothetical protein
VAKGAAAHARGVAGPRAELRTVAEGTLPCALYGVDVTDLERDEKNEILYVASPAALYAYYGGRADIR